MVLPAIPGRTVKYNYERYETANSKKTVVICRGRRIKNKKVRYHEDTRTRVTRSTRADAGARDAVLHGLDGSQPPSGLRSFDGKSSGYRTNGYAVRCSRSRNAESALSGLSDLRFCNMSL
ncbi:hypothetical protein EVAR_89796_1 [Eumeta japonica]|uniref:Uncharacterized protein n=1 Tax=Eumeta variegata TaxID=151549 RepID=A0A4C1ZYA7_EUMVA|nr:hypothetical protein EVAR_89796_1 [Eumeta japonica]